MSEGSGFSARARWHVAAVCAAWAIGASAQVDVSDAWVRGTVAGQRSTGAYMKLVSKSDAKVVAASSPLAKIVEVHEMKLDGGVMAMHAVDALALPAGKPVTLAPNGYHVMLMGLVQPLHDGDTVPITLVVEDKAGKRQDVKVSATVRALTTPAK